MSSKSENSSAVCRAEAQRAERGQSEAVSEETEVERLLLEAKEKALLNAQLQAARLCMSPAANPEHRALTDQGQAVSKLLSDIAAEADEGKLMESVSNALAGVNLNAQYMATGQEVEKMTCGHKLALEILHLPQASGAFKMALVEELVKAGLDMSAEWRDGRAVGTCGCAVLSGVFWIQGIDDGSKVALMKAVLGAGLDVNAEIVERATTASCGTFLMAGATHCPHLDGSSKVQVLSTLLDAGMDLNLPCQQGRKASRTGDTIASRVSAALKTLPTHQAQIYGRLVEGGWDLSSAEDKVRSHASRLLLHTDVDDTLKAVLRRALEFESESGPGPASESQQATPQAGTSLE